VTVTVPPSTEPWKAFQEILKKFLKLIQERVSKDIFIATWDKESDELEKTIKKPRDLPEGAAKNQKHFANYFSGYLNPRKGKESKLYLKVRFITAHPNKLDIALDDFGQELSESITEENPRDLHVSESVRLPSGQIRMYRLFFWLYKIHRQ
jgi:hypothetical protein